MEHDKNCEGCKTCKPNDLGKGGDALTLSEDALSKTLDTIEAIAGATPEGRKQELLKKAYDNSATSEEQEELGVLLKSHRPAADRLGPAITAPLDEPMAKAANNSALITEWVAGTQTALSDLGDRLDKSLGASADHIAALSEGILRIGQLAMAQGELIKSQGDMIKGLGGQIETLGGQPAHGGRAMQPGSPPPGTPPAAPAPGEIKMLLKSLHQESVAKGLGGKAPCGVDINTAVAKLESVGQVDAALMKDLAIHRRQKMEAQG